MQGFKLNYKEGKFSLFVFTFTLNGTDLVTHEGGEGVPELIEFMVQRNS